MGATILWDGDCGFCRRAVAWALEHDRSGSLVAVPWQQAPSPPMTDALARACRDAVHVVDGDGTVLRAGRACLHVASLCGFRWTARALMFAPALWIVEAAYRVVARNRRLFSRILFRP